MDRIALVGLAVGLALYVMPWWSEGRLRWAFWVTFISTLTNVWAAHRKGAASSGRRAAGLNGAAPVGTDVGTETPG